MVVLIVSGCSSSSAESAGNLGIKNADRVDSTVRKLEVLSIQDFNFPETLGTEFFVGLDAIDAISDGIKSTKSRSTNNSSGERAFGGGKYRSRYFNIDLINKGSRIRNAFLDKIDDLYVLCADISVANEKCKQLITEIRSKASDLKDNSKKIKKTNIDKRVLSKFNQENKEFNASVSRLNSDRNNIKSRLRGLPKNSKSSIDVDDLMMRYMMIMNKVETRLKFLEDTKEKIDKLNDEAIFIIDSSSIESAPRVSASVMCTEPKCIKKTVKSIKFDNEKDEPKFTIKTLSQQLDTNNCDNESPKQKVFEEFSQRSTQPQDSPSATEYRQTEKFRKPSFHRPRHRQRIQEPAVQQQPVQSEGLQPTKRLPVSPEQLAS